MADDASAVEETEVTTPIPTEAKKDRWGWLKRFRRKSSTDLELDEYGKLKDKEVIKQGSVLMEEFVKTFGNVKKFRDEMRRVYGKAASSDTLRSTSMAVNFLVGNKEYDVQLREAADATPTGLLMVKKDLKTGLAKEVKFALWTQVPSISYVEETDHDVPIRNTNDPEALQRIKKELTALKIELSPTS